MLNQPADRADAADAEERRLSSLSTNPPLVFRMRIEKREREGTADGRDVAS